MTKESTENNVNPTGEYVDLHAQPPSLNEDDNRAAMLIHFDDTTQQQLVAIARQKPGVGIPSAVRSVPDFQMYIDQHGAMSSIDAEAILIESNRGLVAEIAAKYTNRGLEWESLMAAGYEGLFIGLRKFDPERGVNVSTYVSYWIRQRTALAVIKEISILRIPANKYAVIPRVQELCRKNIPFTAIIDDRELCVRLRLLSAEQWDKLRNCSERDAQSLRRQAREKWRLLVSLTEPIGSLDAPLSSGSFGDTIQDTTTPHTEEIVERATLEAFLQVCEVVLEPRETFIIKMVLQGMSKTQIGKKLALSRERVRQILHIIHDKILQTPALRGYFEEYLASAKVEIDQAHSEDQ